jgi:hypothetical protein
MHNGELHGFYPAPNSIRSKKITKNKIRKGWDTKKVQEI